MAHVVQARLCSQTAQLGPDRPSRPSTCMHPINRREARIPNRPQPLPPRGSVRTARVTAATGGGGSVGDGADGGRGGGFGGGGSSSDGFGGGSGDSWPIWGVGLASLAAAAVLHLVHAKHAAARQHHPQRQQQPGMAGPAGLAGLAAASLLAGAPAVWAAGQQGAAAATEPAGGSPEAPGAQAAAELASSLQPAPQPGSHADSQPSKQEAKPGPAVPKRIVLFVEPSPFTYTSGYQTRFLATIREMVAAGCSVLVVTPGRGAAGLLPGGDPQPESFAGARVLEAGSFPCPGYSTVPLSLGLSPRIFNAVRGWKPDLIHCTSPGALPIAAWIYSRLLRVPMVASFHTHVPTYLPKLGLGWLEGGIWGLIRAIHRAADLTIAVSQQTAADLVQNGACDPRLVKVWPKAVDCERFSPAHASPEMRRRLEGGSAGQLASRASAAAGDSSSGSTNGPLLLYVGRVSSEKNLELLKQVLQRVPGSRLAIVGDGPAMQAMRRHFAGTPTTFLGFLKGRQLAAAYASADVFVMPSESETLGNVVGEAMASGLPVVAAAAGGVPSVIARPGETGILFPPGDAEAAASAVRRLMADAEARRRMSQAARAEMERWSWRHATQQILTDHYPAALAAASGQATGLATAA